MQYRLHKIEYENNVLLNDPNQMKKIQTITYAKILGVDKIQRQPNQLKFYVRNFAIESDPCSHIRYYGHYTCRLCTNCFRTDSQPQFNPTRPMHGDIYQY